MRRPRLSIAGLMLVVATCGVALAAVRGANDAWAVAVQTLAWTLVLGAALGASARRGRARLVWAGFALFGLVALPLERLTSGGLDPEFLPALVIDRMVVDGAHVTTNRSTSWAHQIRICRCLGAVAFAAAGAVVGGLVYPAIGRGPLIPDESS